MPTLRYYILYVVLFLGTIISTQAQELNCRLTINSDRIQGTNKSVFTTLERSASEFINNRRWTDLSFEENERIECTLNIILTKVDGNLFSGEVQVQSRRPVFNASYNTVLINFRDQDFVFNYDEFEVLEFDPNTITSNLTAMLSYYAYLIIGYDMDSYSRVGGTPYFNAAERIVSTAQSLDLPGWRAFESTKNRYALINNLTDEAFKKFRNYIYDYHRLGLDEMSINAVNGRAKINSGLAILRETNRSRPSAIAIATFMEAKTDEIINIFKRATDTEKRNAVEILTDLNPTLTEKYETILKP